MTLADPVQLALSLRRESSVGNEPLDIFAFINRREDVFMIRRFGDSANIDGIYVKDERSGVGFIYLNRAKPLGRQHFTAAHELGHHLLGHNDEFDANIFAAGSSPEEGAANRFAAELLIPRVGLVKFVSAKKLDVSLLPDAIRVAAHFGVTLQPALIQLRGVDRLSGADYNRLLLEFQLLKPNPLAKWEVVEADGKTELPPRFLDVVKSRYLRGEITAEAASEAIDAPVEVVIDRFGAPTVTLAQSDPADLI